MLCRPARGYNLVFVIFLLLTIQSLFCNFSPVVDTILFSEIFLSFYWHEDAMPSFAKLPSFLEANAGKWLSQGSQNSFSIWVWTKYEEGKENAAKKIYIVSGAMLCNLESSQCDCCCTPLLPLLSATILFLFTKNSGTKSLINASDTSRYKNLEILGMLPGSVQIISQLKVTERYCLLFQVVTLSRSLQAKKTSFAQK